MRRPARHALDGARALAVVLVLGSAPALARPFTLDDMLRLERLDQMEITPDGRHLILQTEAAYDAAPRFDSDGYGPPLVGRIKIADTARPGVARDLMTPEPGAGYVAGPVSPSGRAMVVQRFGGGVWDTGVVDLASGRTRWLGLPTDAAVYGRSLQWRSETQLVAIVLARGDLPLHMRTLRQTTERLAAQWRAAAEGRTPTATRVGSGRDLSPWPARPPRRLVEIDLRTRQVRTLAQGDFHDLELSPDGRHLAAVAEADPLPPPTAEPLRVGTPARRRVLSLIDLASGQVSWPLRDGDVLPQLLAWSQDSDQLLVFARPAGQPWAGGELLQVEAAAGALRRPAAGRVTPDLTHDDEGLPVVRADWLAGQPILYGRATGRSSDRADWFRLTDAGAVNLTSGLPAAPAKPAAIGRDALAFVGGGRIDWVDATGRVRPLNVGAGARALSPRRLGEGARFAVNAAPRQDAVWTADDDQVLRLAADGSKLRFALAAGDLPMATSANGLAVRSRDDRGVEVVRLVAASGDERVVLTVNARLAEVDALPVRPIQHGGPGGTTLTSWLYLPSGPGTGAAPPLIVLPYPGSVYPNPPGRYAPNALVFTPNARLLTAHGFAVLAPSLPRAPGSGEPAAGLADAILAAVEAVTRQDLADPDRIALWGHSFGGYGALVTATQTDRFRAIVAQAAKADLASGWGELPLHFRAVPEDGPAVNLSAGWSEAGQGGLGAPPWSDPDRYLRNSPLFAADRIHTPIFLIHGDLDFVSMAQAEAMFAALYRQGKDAVLMTLIGEGHLPASPANVREVYAQVLPWLDRALATRPPATPPDRPGPPPGGPANGAAIVPRPQAAEARHNPPAR